MCTYLVHFILLSKTIAFLCLNNKRIKPKEKRVKRSLQRDKFLVAGCSGALQKLRSKVEGTEGPAHISHWSRLGYSELCSPKS